MQQNCAFHTGFGVSSCMRFRARRNVDFPQPLGPMMAVTAFEATSRLTLSIARFSPYQIDMFFTSNVRAGTASSDGQRLRLLFDALRNGSLGCCHK